MLSAICQPLTTLPRTVSRITLIPSTTPASIALRTSGVNTSMLNVAPGAMPSVASRAIVFGSSGSGGFVTSRRLRRLKKSAGDSASTCFGTGVFASTPSLSGTLSGGV